MAWANRITAAKSTGQAVLLSAMLVGCSGAPHKTATVQTDFAALYTSQAEIAYATRFPVASAAEGIARGDQAFAAGDLDRAVFEYVRALEKGGAHADTLAKIGAIHAARGDARLAELAYRWAIKTDARHTGALTGLGVLLLRKREYAAARQVLEAAVQADPRAAQAHNALGVLADIERDHSRAQTHYRQALLAAPKSPVLYNNLGYSRYLGGDDQGAIAAFKQAINLQQNYALAWRNLGLVYARQRRYDEALAAMSKVQSRPQAYNDIGYVAMLSGRFNEAETFFDEALRISPEYYELAAQNARRARELRTSAAKSGRQTR